MIRMVASTSAGHAKSYFSQALSKSDYYLNDQELQGVFRGKIGERLGINGPATKEVFYDLCDNKKPGTKDPLTPRTNDERVIGYDVNFHCPKSVSIINAFSKDDHVLKAFQESVGETMKEMEAEAKTRVRKSGAYDDKLTGELVWGEFIHQTSRPVDGHAPDPHLHCHNFILNISYDENEGKYKAAKFRDIKRQMPYFQARFQKRLADKMTGLGYQVRLTDKAFEIEGVPESAIKLFSKRTDEIGRVAKEKGITDAKELDALGARTRAKKVKGMSMEELKSEWRKQIRSLGENENTDNNIVRFSPTKGLERPDARSCVDQAVRHLFERASVVNEKQLLAMAYRNAIGNKAVTLDQVNEAFRKNTDLIKMQQGNLNLVTTSEVLKEEQIMVRLARKGLGKFNPLYDRTPNISSTLNDGQAAAVKHVLTTKDGVSIIKGAAGTGKTRLMTESVKWIKAAGKDVIVVAPTAQASRGVLREEGFKDAETVAKLLVDEEMQEKLQGQVLWVDEAGLLGTKDMKDILALASQKNARVILGGDTRQHGSVIRGDALRIISTVGKIPSAEVSLILRQKNHQYLSVVQDLTDGNVKLAFEKLEGMGAIKTIDAMNPNDELVADYMKVLKKGKTALVVSPTHKQGDEVTDAIRKKMRSAGMIGKKEKIVPRLVSLSMTEAERGDWRKFTPGQVINFNQNLNGIKKGSIWTVKEAGHGHVSIANKLGKELALPINKAKFYDVLELKQIGLSKGDLVRITQNGLDNNKKKLNNGQHLEVVSVNQKGKLTLRNKVSKASYEVNEDYGHIAHAHCITSHASQGKTVSEVLISQPSSTFGASDAKQFYVSVSRGEQSVKIYTDDKEALLEKVTEQRDRQSAMELVQTARKHDDYVRDNVIQHQNEKRSAPDKNTTSITVEQDYEPRI